MSTQPPFTFISNHGTVLALIGQHKQITAREMAIQIGITERTVHKIIKDLVDEGYIHKTKAGRHNRYEVVEDLPLHHPLARETAIGELLSILIA